MYECGKVKLPHFHLAEKQDSFQIRKKKVFIKIGGKSLKFLGRIIGHIKAQQRL